MPDHIFLHDIRILVIKFMELLRKQPFKQSTLLVFFGFLLSSSMVLYMPLDTGILSITAPYTWIFVLSIVLLCFIKGYFRYLFTSQCSFLLQITQYVLLPMATFATIQQISLFKKEGSFEYTSWKLILSLIIFILILGLASLKIFSLNQIFPGDNNKQILNFSRFVRIYRIIKFILICISFIFLPEQTLATGFIILNCFDFLLINYRITFIKTELEQVLLLANMNNVLTIVFKFLLEKNYAHWELLGIFTFIICYLLMDHPLQMILEFKYLHYFGNAELNKSDFQNKKEKDSIMLLLQCFLEIYDFQQHELLLVFKQSARTQYSQSFITQCKRNYLLALCFYLSIHNMENNSQNNYLHKSKKLNREDFQQTLMRKYEEKYGITATVKEIAQDKKLFFNFVAFCMDSLQSKNKTKLPWSYSNEFFLTHTIKFNQNFIIKKKIYHQLRLHLTKQSIFFRARNQKLYEYMKQSKCNLQMDVTDAQKFIHFESYLQELKDKIRQLCSDELKLIQKLTTKDIKAYQCQNRLIQRWQKKRQVQKVIDKCFNHDSYLYFHEFTFIFLLFELIFCKSLKTVANKLHNKFIIPLKDSKFKENYLLNPPALVCSGLASDQYRFGEIVLTNVTFRKNFSFSQENNQHFTRKVGNLIVGTEQKSKHEHLMIESSKFSQNVVKKEPHNSNNCYLKTNLQSEKIHILKQFSVSTSIFSFFDHSLMYFCSLQEKSEDFFLSEFDYESLQSRQTLKSRANIEYPKTIISQLGLQMSLTRINLRQLIKNGLIQNQYMETAENSNSRTVCQSYQIKQYKLDLEEQKFAKIQTNLRNKEQMSKSQTKMYAYLVFSLIFFLCGVLAILTMIRVSRSKILETGFVVQQFSEMMSETQGCEMNLALYLYLISKIQLGELDNSICISQKIPDLNHFLRLKADICVNARINHYFVNYFMKSNHKEPIFSVDFIKSIGIQSDIPIDYSNYVYGISTTATQFLQSNFLQFHPQDFELFAHFIRLHSSVDNDSFSHKFIYSIYRHTKEKLIGVNMEHRIIAISGIVLGAVCLGIFFILSLKMFINYMEYYNLLGRMDQCYYYQRIRQIKFISHQIEKLSEFNFKKCTFYSNYEIGLQTNSLYEKKNIEININEFHKLIDINQQKIDIKQHVDTHSNLRKVFIFKAKLVFPILIICILLVVSSVFVGFFNETIIKNNFKGSQIIKQGSITKETITSMNFGNWMAFLKENLIRSKEQNKIYLQNSYNYIKNSQFFLLFYQNLDKSLLDQSIFLDICSLINKKSEENKEECQQQLAQMAQYYPVELISIIVKRQYHVWNSIYQKNQMNSADIICRDLSITINQILPSVISSWKVLLEIINIKLFTILQNIQILLFAFIPSSFLFIFILYIKTYNRLLKIIKLEVLTMKTPQQLYKNQYFRPKLNHLYYRLNE